MKAIVAVAKNGVIGNGLEMGWHIREDLLHFKNVTHKSVVVMGRKTYESIGKSLPNRINVILTRDENYVPYDDSDIVLHSIKDVLLLEHEYKEKGYITFCIGGGEVYSLFEYDEIYLTKVEKDVKGEVKLNIPIDEYLLITQIKAPVLNGNGDRIASFYLLKRK